MKITIEHDGVKRAVEGPFNVCISATDATSLIRCLSEAFVDNRSFCWVEIIDRPSIKESEPNTCVLSWREKAEKVDL